MFLLQFVMLRKKKEKEIILCVGIVSLAGALAFDMDYAREHHRLINDMRLALNCHLG